MNHYESGLSALPEHIRHGMRFYIERGRKPGGFLTAVLENNFRSAAVQADDICRMYLPEIARYVHNYAPAYCHGSPDAVRAWITRGGLAGGAQAALVNQQYATAQGRL